MYLEMPCELDGGRATQEFSSKKISVHFEIYFLTKQSLTVWTQLAYLFKWRTAIPLGASPPPG